MKTEEEGCKIIYSEDEFMFEDEDDVVVVDPTFFDRQTASKKENFILIEFNVRKKKTCYIANGIGDKNQDYGVHFFRNL